MAHSSIDGGLPRTRSLRRAKPARLWSIAVAIAVVANLGLVLGLAQVSQLHDAAIAPPLAVRRLRAVPAEPPPPMPEAAGGAQAAQPVEAVSIALPSLDLPRAPVTSDLRLPALPGFDHAVDLPLSIPAFTVIGAADGPVAAPAGPAVGAPAFDTPAQREGAFDLDRYYPRTARLRGITGTSRVRVVIAANGRVSDATVLDSAPEGVFEQAAERLARALRYRPAQAAGQPVASTQDITIAWTIR
ncbi:MAG TPA: energy transducer TonB [Planctomycetota bacterium]|nr:energy transducer TonB [Planctomycetota bacterium]